MWNRPCKPNRELIDLVSTSFIYSIMGLITMKKFLEIPANKNSLAQRKPVYGIGTNDSSYIIRYKGVMCKYYRVWFNMMERCYSSKFQEKKPTYKGCSVCSEWLVFSAFRKWMEANDYNGLELDKDIKVKGNKVYSPDTCLFIPHALNNLLSDHGAARGAYPVGVYFHNKNKRFVAQITLDGNRVHIGCYDTKEQASDGYKRRRTSKIKKLISDNKYPIATKYLEQHI